MKNLIIIFLVLFVSIGCNNNNSTVEALWTEAEEFRMKDDLKSSIEKLVEIKNTFHKHEKAAESQFMIGEIYLNDIKDYDIAITEFNTVISEFPKSKVAEKAMFMIGYVYTNYLDAYSDGIAYYNDFKNKYPNSDLIQSVDYELENLADIKTEIENLNVIASDNKGENQ
ncbi:MAG: tetratricopeptide repeat protein [Candidatus Marinimicrobia bacterium]|nr:tetratricopeptide repeat protein [Candidatus Neomarinimicrobiota bacterium]MBT3633369.1 tetratricopeptide repeat protein [Candidatus Neomarinimicrobiota bacterium]MBT3681512.1 tetratricopeptide repeat protein [Candidatus Neomarinimicrobiota bacterium]MBT3758521.1 tetratricopeptide repeat protein [Candidatus Neomarinimicrobiota bacterium]MBT3894825.1 tetratricopeptide repeat protein [Candidatus Neomarinimicrobiota bacterium]